MSVTDWDEIIELSARHGVTPLLWQRLRTLSPSIGVPAAAVQELRQTYLHNLWKNTRRYYELSKVLIAVQNISIPVIVLKGAALAELVYQSIALRPMVDVDLLVKGKDAWEVHKALLQLGYKDATFLLSKRHVPWVRHLVYENQATRIEVHAKIPELPDLDPWVNSSPAKIASTDTLVLGPEDLLLHLCLHLDNHLRFDGSLSRLIWWCDIAEVLKRYGEELDWGHIVQAAREHRVERAIHRILCMIDEWSGGHVPKGVLGQFEDDDAMVSMSDLLHSARAQSPELNSFLLSISRIPSIRNRIYHVFRLMFPCKEFIIRLYSPKRPKQVYLYYFARIYEDAARVLKAFWQLPGHLKSKHALRSLKSPKSPKPLKS